MSFWCAWAKCWSHLHACWARRSCKNIDVPSNSAFFFDDGLTASRTTDLASNSRFFYCFKCWRGRSVISWSLLSLESQWCKAILVWCQWSNFWSNLAVCDGTPVQWTLDREEFMRCEIYRLGWGNHLHAQNITWSCWQTSFIHLGLISANHVYQQGPRTCGGAAVWSVLRGCVSKPTR